MIELNLLPVEFRKKTETVLPEIPILPISIIVTIIVVIVHFFLVFMVNNRKAYLEKSEKEWTGLQPRRKIAEKLDTEVRLLELRVQATKNITNPELEWAELLSGLNQAMIPDVWLTSFTPTIRKSGNNSRKNVIAGNVLELQGFAKGTTEGPSIVGKFIDSLKWNTEFSKYFNEIKLHGMKKQKVSGEEVMAFKLLCYFKTAKPIVT